jgi:hypothetical protein
VVILFPTPPQSSAQRFDVQLYEKNGNRHVLLEGLSL